MNTQRKRAGSDRSPRAAGTGARPDDRPGGAQAPIPADPLWGIAEVGDYLQLTVNAVYKMTAPKAAVRIPHIRIGGKLRFRKSDVDRWLTLLTVSNLDVLAKLRERAAKVSHGNNSQTDAR